MKDQYVSYLFATYLRSSSFDKIFGEGWIREEDLPNLKAAVIKDAFNRRDLYVDPQKFEAIFESVFLELLSNRAFRIEGDDLVGHWYKLDLSARNAAVEKYLGRLDVTKKLTNLGPVAQNALQQALSRIVAEEFDGVPDQEVLASGVEDSSRNDVPASDRIVSLDHNSAEYRQIEDGLRLLSDELRGNNQFGQTVEDRLRIVKSVEAARELWQSVDLKLIQVQVGIVMAIEDAGAALEKVGKATACSMLVDLIKSIIRDRIGISV